MNYQIDEGRIIVALLLCAALSIYAYHKGILDYRGTASAFVIGMLISLASDITWLVLLLFFMIAGFIVTKYKIDEKIKNNVSQGMTGKRGVKNVIGNALIPTGIAFLYIFNNADIIPIVYAIAIATATSDTFASEIGVTSKRAYNIIKPWKRVKPGTDGGISIKGEIASLFGSFISALTAMILFDILWKGKGIISISMLFFITLIGFIGCQIDSLLGITLQKRKILNNNSVNHVAIALASLIGFIIYLIINF